MQLSTEIKPVKQFVYQGKEQKIKILDTYDAYCIDGQPLDNAMCRAFVTNVTAFIADQSGTMGS